MEKNINLIGVFSISTGAMISSGIFILPGLAFTKAGPATFISYIVGGLMAMAGILSIIELSTAMPKAGGDYFFINKTFGALLGTISGLLGWIAITLKSAFAIFGIAEILFTSFGIPILVSAAILCMFFFVVNAAGIKEAVFFQILMVMGLLLILFTYVFIGIPQIELNRFSNLFSHGLNSIIITSGFIFISFGGLLKVANISEEVKNPKRNIPLGMLLSILIVTILYGLIVIVLTGTLDPAHFSTSLTPVADSAKILAGFPGYIAIIVASLLAFITTANAGLMSASRYPLALSRDQLLPPFFSKVTSKKKAPLVALGITSSLMFITLLLPLELLVKAASTVVLTSYVLTNLAVIILRESNLTNYQPSFKVPFYPWLQIINIVLFSYFIVDLGAEAIEISILFILGCVLLYFFYGKKNNKGDFALLYLLKRIADSRLTEDFLETELREILISRDEIEQDAFDSLIRNASVEDISGPIEFPNLLSQISTSLSAKAGIEPSEIIQKFLDRQNQYNTAISHFLAIPHILIKGEGKMFMHLVRCKEGINFGQGTESVKAVFFLGGSKDVRILHLKTIASIASLTAEKEFQKQWIETTKPNDLKHLMILSKRKRYF